MKTTKHLIHPHKSAKREITHKKEQIQKLCRHAHAESNCLSPLWWSTNFFSFIFVFIFLPSIHLRCKFFLLVVYTYTFLVWHYCYMQRLNNNKNLCASEEKERTNGKYYDGRSIVWMSEIEKKQMRLWVFLECILIISEIMLSSSYTQNI